MNNIIRKLAILAAILALVVASCASCADLDSLTELKDSILGSILPDSPEEPKDPADPADPADPEQPEQPEQPEKSKAELWAEQYQCITVAEALTMCEDYVSSPSTERFYLIVTIKSIDDTSYGKMTVADETGEIMVYGTYSADGALKFNALTDAPKAGDIMLIHGTLQNYKGNTKEIQNARLIDFYTPEGASKPEDEITVKPGDTITIEEAMAIAGKVDLNNRYIIEATVKSIVNSAYGQMIIEDETGEISVYGSYNADGTVGYSAMEDKPFKGDTVVLSCTLQDFNGTKEIKSAWILEFEHATFDESQYTAATVAEARAADKDAKLKVSGVVARITYANGMKPSGFILIDGTSSIYVYGGDAAQRVAIGNTVTVAGTKDYWILDTETNLAAKFGYQGCNQLSDAYLLENDGLTTAFDTEWIEETTIKDIMETPATTDITSIVYKVNALVKRVDGTGFINYYFDDIDGVTGSYTYTQCNGGDFEWLDEFDGKICTVYITALNAKSAAAGCVWRFLPIAVSDDGYTFDQTTAPEYAIKYHAKDQFVGSYTADPELELITSVSSELLGFENVTVSYSSDNTAVVYFTTADGKTVMHCGEYGSATVTITASFGGKNYSETVEIVFSEAVEYDFISVEDAIAANVGDTVIVKGIVGPSLVNKTGFYLMGENGLIAVLTDSNTMATLAIGNEVIISATRHNNTKGGATYYGQTCLKDAVLLVNNNGNHEYNDDYFVTGKTLADLVNLDITVDYTTSVYVVKANIEYIKTGYYTSLKLTYNGAEFPLYMSGAGQYSFLDQFAGEEVTLEIALCNWNDKTDKYRGCILSVITYDGKVYNELNFNS